MSQIITAEVRPTVSRRITCGRIGNGNPTNLAADFLGNLAIDMVLPPKALRAAAGVRYGAVVGNGATFKAPVTAIPTTTATWLLYNGESEGGKSFFIDTLFAFLASGTNGAGAALLAAVTLSSQSKTNSGANPAAYSGAVISNLSGKANGSKAVLANAWTISGDQPAWLTVAKSEAAAAATIAAQVLHAEIGGGLIVPPGYGLAITVLSGVGTTALYGVGATWDEIQAELE
jgi:hypothetical protein